MLGVRGSAESQQTSRAARQVDETASRRRGQREEDFAARKRGQAKDEADVGAEAAARHEHEALAPFGELIRELHRDAAAERVADDRRAIEAERATEVTERAGERAERVVAGALRRPAVAR